jgi:hypothetical protein
VMLVTVSKDKTELDVLVSSLKHRLAH